LFVNQKVQTLRQARISVLFMNDKFSKKKPGPTLSKHVRET